MSHDYTRRPGQSSTRSEIAGAGAGVPGKRTLTMDLPVIDAPVQRKPGANSAAEPAQVSPTGSGQSLPDAVRSRMESSLGADFSAVRVHEGPQAPALGAVAYTQGADIHFAPGEYQPASQRGQALIGHELAHVVQQSEGRVAATTQFKGVDGNDDAGLEREADEWGARAGSSIPSTAITRAA